jgi:hypothetical protein
MMMDSRVLIDLIAARPDLLELIAIHVAPVYAIGAVVDEVNGIEETELSELGVVIVESDIEDAYRVETLSSVHPETGKFGRDGGVRKILPQAYV